MTGKSTSTSSAPSRRAPKAPDKAVARASAKAQSASHAHNAESKIGKVVALLGREQGATLQEMTAATGWQPHTMRAALTGLRKKEHAIERSLRGEASCYRIKASA